MPRPDDVDFMRVVDRHYTSMTERFYLNGWNRDHIHLGLFEPGELPPPGVKPRHSAGVARAVERMIDVVVGPAVITERHHVVDAGCGVGGTAIHLASAHGCRVTGVNMNRLQLEIAQEKVADAGVADRVGLEYADCCKSLPFADNTIDVVVNIESACHYSDRERFLREVQRILKPGGKIVAMDWMARDHLSAEQYEEFIRPVCESWAMVSLESPATYASKLQEAGLEIMEFEGFGGKEMDNLKIIENDYRNLTLMYFGGFRTPPFLNLMDSIGRLYAAWRDGYFEIRRYCAKK